MFRGRDLTVGLFGAASASEAASGLENTPRAWVSSTHFMSHLARSAWNNIKRVTSDLLWRGWEGCHQVWGCEVSRKIIQLNYMPKLVYADRWVACAKEEDRWWRSKSPPCHWHQKSPILVQICIEVGIEKAFLVDSESTWLLYHLHWMTLNLRQRCAPGVRLWLSTFLSKLSSFYSLPL